MMCPIVKVQSIDDLDKWRSSLSQFVSETKETLNSTELKIRHTEEWLQGRLSYWRYEVEECQREMERAREELEECENNGEEDYNCDCSEEEEKINEAMRRLKNAKEELTNIQSWMRQVTEIVAGYRRQTQRLNRFLDKESPRANAFLGRVVADLYAYIRVAPPESEHHQSEYDQIGERKILLKNFEVSSLTTNKRVIEFIKKKIPLKAIKGVPSIEYINILKSSKNGWVTLEEYNKITKEITAYKHPEEILASPMLLKVMTSDEITKKLENKIYESLTHGIGHNVYNQIMTDEQYQKWGDICFESEQEGKPFISEYIKKAKDEGKYYIEEDFCECFRYFIFDSDRLKDVDEIKYNFIKNICSALKERGSNG